MNGYAELVKEMLTKHGWAFSRSAKGSHEYWKKEGHKPVTVPHGCKSRFTANAIMKEAGIDHRW